MASAAGGGDARLPDGRPGTATLDKIGPEQILPPAQQQTVPDSAELPRHEDKLSVCSKLCYAIGGAPNQVASSATAFFLQIYLLEIAQITPFHASLVLFVGKACGAVADPVAGFFISKSKWTKIGRLMPWMLGCTPFIIVSYFFLWYLPPFIAGRVVWYLAFYCLFQALTTFFLVPYCALTMFLSTEQKDRDSATAYRITVEVLGTLIGAALQGQIVASAHASDHCSQNSTVGFSSLQQNSSSLLSLAHGRNVYMIAAGVIGGIYLVSIVVLFLGVKEKDDPYALSSDKTVPFFKGLRLTMKYGPYMKLTASFLLISTAVQLEQGNFVLFCTHTTGLRSHFQNLVMTILWMIPFVIMLVTIPNLTVTYVAAFVSGLSIAASLLLPWSMLPDVVDHFRLQNPHSTGHEFVGYESGACGQSDSVVTMLKVLVGGVPAGLIFLGLFILLFYPINKKSQKETKYALEMLRQTHPSTENLNENEENTPL
ncbi:PREDICTED: major facilitator superfamily domain-containing protein 2B [Gekko japonicus]|uniref:Major facilitator superfamily domain-containing protein 2B n=1 Tax=Gekko japonicus TaxID=146911 RepID=A0ABM1JMY4_GEKJA|nr:PREDICTED: major facilitator superfamily domain-containing protein 2B [Gekko japonicus]